MTPEQSLLLHRLQNAARALELGARGAFAAGDRKAAAKIFARRDVAETRAVEYAEAVGTLTEDGTDDDFFRFAPKGRSGP